MMTLLEVLAEYGLVSAIIVACIILMVVTLKGKFSGHSSPGSIGETPVDPVTALRNNDFFNNIEFKINIDLPIETFSVEVNRNVMYRDIMIYLFESYVRNMRIFINDLTRVKTSAEWTDTLHSTQYSIIEEFKESCIRNSVPQQVLSLFMTWYNPHISRIHLYISSIGKMSDTAIYSKSGTFLLILELLLATITADAQRAPKLNGELDGLVYKGLHL